MGQHGENGAEPANYRGREYIIAFPDWQTCVAGTSSCMVELRGLGDDVRLRLSVGHGAGVHEMGDNAESSAGFRGPGLFQGLRHVGGVWSAEGISGDSS